MSQGKTSKRLSVSIHQPLNLGALRWLVGQTEDLPDSATVSVVQHAGDRPFDATESSITVSGELA